MEKGAISDGESSKIVVSILSRFMGYFDRNSESFADFVVERLLKQVQVDGGFWRRDYHAVIRVEELSDAEVEKWLFRDLCGWTGFRSCAAPTRCCGVG